ncbi:hypothetical protein CRV01_01085 [Arcobacter sp. CECT 8983]|uniref:nucleotidyltransferase family protein n=1 Tax=Arcobacter sp. CECT 8983 TaxID=2044508 RepID=UPI00100A874D|nr:nucleotidyltransferase family protein [Arcobacter sp. CECT 8983]RXJ91714.1 hypothetical protein CRV01_01085 [Arcobacter sp. CECT 8983]
MEKSKNLSVVILAAGKASRFGKAKQLLEIQGQTLLELSIKKALTISDDVNVILGSYADLCIEKIKDFNIKYHINKEFESGMASSLKLGISKVENNKDILVMLCDMPLVPLTHYESLVKVYSNNKNKIVCSKYKDKFLVPAIFPNKYFDLFKKLSGDKGAKNILKEYDKDYVILEDKYAIDIDTKEDFDRILATKCC